MKMLELIKNLERNIHEDESAYSDYCDCYPNEEHLGIAEYLKVNYGIYGYGKLFAEAGEEYDENYGMNDEQEEAFEEYIEILKKR